MKLLALATALVWSGLCPVALASNPQLKAAQGTDSVRAFLTNFEQAARSGDPAAYLALLADTADRRRAADFATAEFRRGATRVVLLERDREPLLTVVGGGLRVFVDAFVEVGPRGRVATWRLDLSRNAANVWVVANQERVSSVDSLHRLVLNPAKQFSARNFSIRAEDLDLTLEQGSVFTVDTDQGVTALVLTGRGTMRFHPTPQVERRQVEIFSGSETLVTRFDAAYVRFGDLSAHTDLSRLTERPVDAAEFRRADLVFREESSKSFAFDLSAFTNEAWTMLPAASDFLAEVRTRQFGTLTYSRASSLPEDVSLFDHSRQKNISVYASAERLATGGRFFNPDDRAQVDVRDYDIDLTFDPARRWIEATARLQLTIGATPTNQLRLSLAPSLTVTSLTSDQLGRLFGIRVSNQDTLIVVLPALLLPDTDLTMTVTYSGSLPSQPTDWESLTLGGPPMGPPEYAQSPTATPFRFEPRFLYSNQVQWYPRPPVSDYATARLHITVPEGFEPIASGSPAPGSPTWLAATSALPRRQRRGFIVARPLRYLSFFVTPLAPVERTTVTFRKDVGGAAAAPLRAPGPAGAPFDAVDIDVLAHARIVPQARDLAARAADIMRFYDSIVGDTPYSSLTLALIEGTQPGGHSPGHLSVITQPPANQPRFWRNDPAAFDTYPDFFPAHEIAHQWWGQAVGWSTYHDQWLSEGFAHYFAALYVRRTQGDDAFREIMTTVGDWAMRESAQGPIYLGYRLGHVRNDTRTFRALVYDKGAAVLHMLRRLVGDDTFFLGVRGFYAEWRYRKASSEDLRHAMEAASGRSLERFFERWVYGSSLPRLRFSYRLEAPRAGDRERSIVLRVEQTGDLFDVPVTVVLQYADRPSAEVTIAVTDRVTELRVPLAGPLRRVDLGQGDGTLADIRR